MVCSAGVTDENLVQITEGPDTDSRSAREPVILHTADELHTDARNSETAWVPLAERYDICRMV